MSTFTAPQRNAIVRRLARAVRSATAAQRDQGLVWYRDADRAIRAIAAITGPGVAPVSVDTVAGVFAALSPRTHVRTNVAWCAAMVHAARTGQACPQVHTRVMRGQAWRIAQGEDWRDVLRGPKVRAFAANLTGDMSPVTVDVWMVRAIMGDAAPEGGAIGAALYRECADIIRRVARAVGEAPAVTQAIIWVVTKDAARYSAGNVVSTADVAAAAA